MYQVESSLWVCLKMKHYKSGGFFCLSLQALKKGQLKSQPGLQFSTSTFSFKNEQKRSVFSTSLTYLFIHLGFFFSLFDSVSLGSSLADLWYSPAGPSPAQLSLEEGGCFSMIRLDHLHLPALKKNL